MTIKSEVKTTLEAVLMNSFAVDLPDEPTWPAIVYEIESEKETGWTKDGAYVRHFISVTIYSDSLSEVATLRDQVEAAMMPLSDNNGADDEGDSDYEKDARVYAYFLNFTARKQDLT